MELNCSRISSLWVHVNRSLHKFRNINIKNKCSKCNCKTEKIVLFGCLLILMRRSLFIHYQYMSKHPIDISHLQAVIPELSCYALPRNCGVVPFILIWSLWDGVRVPRQRNWLPKPRYWRGDGCFYRTVTWLPPGCPVYRLLWKSKQLIQPKLYHNIKQNITKLNIIVKPIQTLSYLSDFFTVKLLDLWKERNVYLFHTTYTFTLYLVYLWIQEKKVVFILL